MSTDLQLLSLCVKRLQYKHHRTLDSKLIEIGTTLAQWDALRAIERHPQSSSHKLAGLTFQSDQSFGTLANRMIERGLIQREAGQGRAIHHQVTRAGQAMLTAGHAVVNAVIAESFAPLSGPERTQLQALLNRLLRDQEA